MAHLSPSTSDNQESHIVALTRRKMVLFASAPSAQKIVASIEKKGVHLLHSISDLNDHSSLQPDQANTKNSTNINSIIILACPGDDISAVTDIYEFAVNKNLLVTTIIVYKSSCMPISNFKSLAKLRASSDMVVITSDENYLEYMLECLL